MNEYSVVKHRSYSIVQNVLLQIKPISSVQYKCKIVGIVMDEAHYVWTWGDEFRIVLAQICELQSLIPAAGVNIDSDYNYTDALIIRIL